MNLASGTFLRANPICAAGRRWIGRTHRRLSGRRIGRSIGSKSISTITDDVETGNRRYRQIRVNNNSAVFSFFKLELLD